MTAIASLELFSATDTWQIDPDRSSIGFRVTQRLIESVRGRFLVFEGLIEPGAAPRFVGSIQVASLVTDHPKRDQYLRSAEFFDSARFPTMQFTSTSIGLGDCGSLLVTGELTIKEATRPIVLEGALIGASIDSDGQERVGFELCGDLNRLDFDLSWDRLPEGGDLVVGNEIELALDLVARKAPALEQAA